MRIPPSWRGTFTGRSTPREPETDPPRPAPGIFRILSWGLWFGAIVGLLELGLTLAFKAWRDPAPLFFRLNRHVVWMIPAFNLALFLGVAVLAAAVARIRPKIGPRPVAYLFCFPAFLTLLLSYHPLYAWACLILAGGLAVRSSRRIARNEAIFQRLVVRSSPLLAVAALAVGGLSYYREVVVARRPKLDAPPAAPGAPNVLFVVLDTVRADRLSAFGYDRPTTPNLEKIAAKGVRFDRARSASPWTLPSHASLMTGRWPHQLSADFFGPLDDSFPTIAEFLSSRGYATGGFVANVTYVGAETGMDRGFARFDDHDTSASGVLQNAALSGRLLWPFLAYDARAGFWAEILWRKDAAEVNREVLDWLGEAPRDRPYFAFLNYFDAHNPYLPPKGFDRHIASKPASNADFEALEKWFILDKKAMPEDRRRMVSDAYDDCLTYLDEQLGRLFSELERRRALDNTLVVLTADHGEHFGCHELYGHASSLYDQEIHVPLIVIPPRDSPSGKVVDQSVSTREISATIADLAGFDFASPFPGKSLARFWCPETDAEGASAVFSEVQEPAKAAPNQGRSPVFRGAMKSLVADERLYILNGDGVEELYDLRRDPLNRLDLAARPESLPALEAFRARVSKILQGEPPMGRSAALMSIGKGASAPRGTTRGSGGSLDGRSPEAGGAATPPASGIASVGSGRDAPRGDSGLQGRPRPPPSGTVYSTVI